VWAAYTDFNMQLGSNAVLCIKVLG
jgi:hypothetical protein